MPSIFTRSLPQRSVVPSITVHHSPAKTVAAPSRNATPKATEHARVNIRTS
jgi:hypothetical protein